MTLSEKLKRLDPSDYSKLLYAFEHDLSNQYVMVSERNFLGVNITMPNFRKLEESGRWSYGVVV